MDSRFLLRVCLMVIVGGALAVGVALAGEDTEQLASAEVGATVISWQAAAEHAGADVSIQGPNGTVMTRTFDYGEPLSMDLARTFGNPLEDGKYSWEVSFHPVLSASAQRALDGAVTLEERDAVRRDLIERGELPAEPAVASSSFRVENGAIWSAGDGGQAVIEEADDARGLEASYKDQVIADDLIVQFSACIGNDCVNGESFGFDTMRLKENNLRIHFDDTSVSASFPRNDWRITVNDSGNGGDSYFSIDDATAGRQVFRVDAGAPANSLRVDAGGDVGIGESNPVVELHIADGDSPTLRLEQDGSSGFAPQTWDVAGNEANFFIRDVTNGSELPFKIKPGADTSSIFIAANSNVGINTESPGEKLHVRGGSLKVENGSVKVVQATGGYAELFNLENNSGIGFVLNNTANDALYISVNNPGTEYTINFADGDGPEMAVDKDGNMTGVTSCVSCDPPSDRNLKEGFANVDSQSILHGLRQLDVMEWRYRELQPGVRHIGPMSQDFHATFGVGRDTTLSPLDTFGVAAASIQALADKVEQLEALVLEQQALIEQLRGEQ